MSSKVSIMLSSTFLLLLCLQIAAISKPCSEGSCPVDDSIFGEANELSLMQATAIEKRAQEKAEVQKLDTAVKKKGKAASEKTDGKQEKMVFNNKESKAQAKDTSKLKPAPDSKDVLKEGSKAESKDASKDESKSTSKHKTEKKQEKSKKKKQDPWTLAGSGCCEGARELSNGKLFGGRVADLEACKTKCRSFHTCGAIEFGWNDDPHWCFVWNDQQTCEVKDPECTNSVIGNGRGAQVYRFWAPSVDYEAAKKAKWDIVGPGCCDGLRDESNGKLYASKEPTLDACKARCLSFENCGIVEYGWQTGDPEWCFIWDDRQKCEKQDLECKQTLMAYGRGATAHKLLRAED